MSTLENGASVGRYRITRFLGAGAMGEVYLAEDPHIERTLAIKTVRLVGRENDVEERKRRLLREARAAGKILHPHIVTLFDAGEADGILFLAFEFVEGSDLATRVEKGPPLQLAEVLKIARQTAEALEAAHKQGIVHRDIKPSNLLVDTAGEIKVADFGIAKVAGQNTELTVSGSVMGSPQYLSPEQIRGEELDGRSDVFSLGVVLYELLSGRRPFDGDTLTTLVYKILHQEPPPIADLRAVPPRLEQLLVRMLEKDRDRRMPSAGAVAQELAAIERDLPDETLSARVVPSLLGKAGAVPLSAAGTVVPSAPGAPPFSSPPPPSSPLGSGGTTRPDRPSQPPPAPAPPSAPTMRTESGLVPPPPPAVAAAAVTTARRLPIALILGLVAVAGVVFLVVMFLGWKLIFGKKPLVPPEITAATGPNATTSDLSTVVEDGASTDETDGGAQPPIGETFPQTPPFGTRVPPSRDGNPLADKTSPYTPPLTQSAPRAEPTRDEPTTVETREAPFIPARPTVVEEVPEPEPAPRPRSSNRTQTGLNLAFRVAPPDAFVLVDGTLVGKVAEFSGLKGSKVFDVDPGEHTIKFRKAGMEDYVVEIDASGASTSVIAGRLRPMGARDVVTQDLDFHQVVKGIVLKVEPDSASVTVDGSPARFGLGSTSSRRGAFLALGPGTHRISITAPGYKRRDFAVEVNPEAEDDRKRIEIRLVPGEG